MPTSGTNGNVLTLTLGSPTLSQSSKASAMSPRIAAGSLPMSPSTSQQSTPSMSKRSLSIKRKPVPAYLDDAISLRNSHPSQNGHKGTYVLSVDQPLGDEEVLRSPVRVSFEQGHEDGVSPPTPFNGFVKNSPQLSMSSAFSSPVLPSSQSQTEGGPSAVRQSSVANPVTLNAIVGPPNGDSKEVAADHMRRVSGTSMSSSISSGNSDFAQPNGSRPPSAARNTLLGRSLYNLNSPEANNMSTDQLFTIPPHEDPSAKSRASRSHPSLLATATQADGARASNQKPLDRDLTALRITGVDEGANAPYTSSDGLSGLGIRGAHLGPSLRATTEELPQSIHDSLDTGIDIQITQSRLNRSLPSLPVNRTTTNLGTAPRPREKGIFGKKQAKIQEEFSESAVPTPMRLWEASQCHLVDETGRKRRFGDFWDTYAVQQQDGSDTASGRKHGHTRVASLAKDLVGHHHRHGHHSHAPGARQSIDSARGSVREKAGSVHSSRHSHDPKIGGEEYIVHGRRTAVFWIRHFWCGQCQDYTLASLGLLDAEAIHKAGLNVIVISNGSWKIIKRYRELFKCPFPIYVDASRRLYQLMGMTKMSNDFGPFALKDRAAYHQHAVPRQVVGAIGKALFKLPLANPGTLTQLGGEFIVGPGLKCEFAHRMTNTSNHMEAYDVLRLAGVQNCMTSDVKQAQIAQEELKELNALQAEEEAWRESRMTELERIKRRKEARRGVVVNGGELGGVEHDEEDVGEDELDPEERRARFEEFRRRTGMMVDQEEDFDGFVVRKSEMTRKRLSTPMEHEEE